MKEYTTEELIKLGRIEAARREKIGAAQVGRELTPEHRAKLAIAAQKREARRRKSIGVDACVPA